MGLFDPWMMGQNFGGILGGIAPTGYGQQDIEALIKGYGPKWQNTPQDPLNGDQGASSPLSSAPANPYGNPNSLMPSFSSTISTEGLPQQQQAGGPWLRPGSFLDKLLGQPQMAANAAPAPQQPQQPGSGAEPNAVWGYPPPQMANVPMPLPRPAPGVNLGMPAQQPPLEITPQNNASPPPVQSQPQQPAPQAAPQMAQSPGFGDRLGASAQGFFNAGSPMQAIGNLLGGAVTGNRMDLRPMELGTDPNTGQKMFGVYDPGTQAIKSVGGGGVGGAGQNNGFLAPGVPYLNSSATGDAYLKQWSPEVQAAAKAYLAGNIVPTGNPRQNALASKAKEVAMKYAADNGIEFSDAKFSEMRKFRTELGSTAPATVGGAAKAFGQGIEHMEKLGQTDLAMNNSNGFGIPKLAEWANGLRQATSTEQRALAAKSESIGQTLAGEVGKLFSGQAGGGVEERRQTRERFNSIKSPPELAAALEATLETMDGGLAALEKHRARVFSGNPPPDTELVDAGTKEKIKTVEKIIAQLRGGASTAPAPSSGWSVKRL